jgi:hypothetical protein
VYCPEFPHVFRPLFDGRIRAMLFSVRNHLGDLLGVDSALQLRRTSVLPIFWGPQMVLYASAFRPAPAQAHSSGRRVVCSANSSLIAVNGNGGQFGLGVLRLFDLTSGWQIAELRQNPAAGTAFRQISLSPDGSKLAILLQNPRRTPTKSPNVEIRETKHLTLLSQFTTGDVPDGLTFSGDSEVVTVQGQATGRDSSRRALQLWNVESGKEIKRYSDASGDVEWPISSSADGTRILGYIPTFRECRFCNGLEGRRDVKEQRFAVWNKITGAEIYRSEPFRPMVEPLGPQPVLSQDGTTAMVYWPDNVITPRLFPVP